MPVTVQSLDLLIPDVATTTRLAADLADRLRGGEIVLLEGDLGAGKTTFVRGLVARLGDCEASSPSFTIENIYPTPSWTIHHYDFHRLVDLGIEGLVLQEAIADPHSVVIIEWPEIVRPLCPSPADARVSVPASARCPPLGLPGFAGLELSIATWRVFEWTY